MMDSLDKFKNEFVLTHSIAFSPMYEVHLSRNEAVHLTSIQTIESSIKLDKMKKY